MNEKQRERVEKLISLALNNPSAAESASVALAACRLIREHKMLDVPPPQAPQSKPVPDYYQQPSWYQAYQPTRPPIYQPTRGDFDWEKFADWVKQPK